MGQSKDKESSAPICRICLSEAKDPSNPFVAPCNCSGTMKYLHISCLQHWNLSKLHLKESAFSNTYIWKNFECELCKKGYPCKNQNLLFNKGIQDVLIT